MLNEYCIKIEFVKFIIVTCKYRHICFLFNALANQYSESLVNIRTRLMLFCKNKCCLLLPQFRKQIWTEAKKCLINVKNWSLVSLVLFVFFLLRWISATRQSYACACTIGFIFYWVSLSSKSNANNHLRSQLFSVIYKIRIEVSKQFNIVNWPVFLILSAKFM